MIANNFRKYAEALALQLPLPFGHLLKWALPRPGSRVLRAIRAARAAAFKAAGRVRHPEARNTPAWARQAARKAHELGKAVLTLQMPLVTQEVTDLKGYAAYLARCKQQSTGEAQTKALNLVRACMG